MKNKNAILEETFIKKGLVASSIMIVLEACAGWSRLYGPSDQLNLAAIGRWERSK